MKDAECVWVHSVNPGALLSSIPFLFVQQLFYPSKWPLHSSAVCFLGGLVSCDQIRLLLKVNFLSRQSITPPTSTWFDMPEFSNYSRTLLYIYVTETVCWFLSSHKGRYLQRIESQKLQQLQSVVFGQPSHFWGNLVIQSSSITLAFKNLKNKNPECLSNQYG